MKYLIMLVFMAGCAESKIKTKDILVIGDSISIGYTPTIGKLMPDYRVVHSRGNARNSFYAANNAQTWLNEQDQSPEIIIWNNGIWNTIHNYTDEPLQYLMTSFSQYENDLDITAKILKKTGARIIFVTTTNIDSGTNFYDETMLDQLNASARVVMEENGIEVFDLNAVSNGITNLKIDPVHYSPEGYYILGESIVNNAIKKVGI